MVLLRKKKSSIEPGKYADFTVLSQDIQNVAEEKIMKTEVLQTIADGEIVSQKK
ncbi:MAG TPA: amidohydrolase family protein [Saprospiraceae bacterium]|nr:amidohydrolase family protein [Saprospiraceae bacterium]